MPDGVMVSPTSASICAYGIGESKGGGSMRMRSIAYRNA